MSPVVVNTALTLSIVACAGSLFTLWLALRRRAEEAYLVALVDSLQDETERLKRITQNVVEREQRRTRLTSNTTFSDDSANLPLGGELVASEPAKPTATERRHRVLALARRGQDADTISAMLGMPYGEVELILNLSALA